MEDNYSQSPTPQMPQSPMQDMMLGKMASDMKITGVGYVIAGILSCLGIITAIIGIPMVIAGLRAMDASAKMKEYIQVGDEMQISSFYDNLAQHFKMMKIYFVIYLVFFILGIIFYGLFFAAMIGGIMEGM